MDQIAHPPPQPLSPDTPPTPRKRVGRPSTGITKRLPKARFFRLVIPRLQQFRDASHSTRRDLRQRVVDLLVERQKPRGLTHWTVALETHASGIPHLGILLGYGRLTQNSPLRYDYVLKHGDLTQYRRLNRAIVQYGRKQDPGLINTFPRDVQAFIEVTQRERQVRRDSYAFLQSVMLRDPLKFNLDAYMHQNRLFREVKSWSTIKSKLRDAQVAAANAQLRNLSGFVPITRQLIQSRLSPEELRTYDSWSGYQVIVDHLNQIPRYGSYRPFKTPNLLVVGPPGVGKTSLLSEPDNERSMPTVEGLSPVYHMGMRDWFPAYESGVYGGVLFGQFKLTSYSYGTMLKFLQGSPMDLPRKGGSYRRVGNPLVYMTSNLRLSRHIAVKFYAPEDRKMARLNLAPRITEVVVPPGLDLFLLRRLVVPRL